MKRTLGKKMQGLLHKIEVQILCNMLKNVILYSKLREKEVLFMSSIVMNRVITENQERAEKPSLLKKIGKYITKTSEVMALGVFAMNNTYYHCILGVSRSLFTDK